MIHRNNESRDGGLPLSLLILGKITFVENMPLPHPSSEHVICACPQANIPELGQAEVLIKHLAMIGANELTLNACKKSYHLTDP